MTATVSTESRAPGENVLTARVSVPTALPSVGCSTSSHGTAGRDSPATINVGSQSSIVDARTTSRLRWVASGSLRRPDRGWTKGRSGSPVEVTRRTVSPYCRSERVRPDHSCSAASTGFAGSEMSRSSRWVPSRPPGKLPGITRWSKAIIVGCEAETSTWSPTRSRPSAYSSCGSCHVPSLRGVSPVTSVSTTRRPSWRRTTIRPSVLATSGSSTPASWRLVPVGPLATEDSEVEVSLRARGWSIIIG